MKKKILLVMFFAVLALVPGLVFAEEKSLCDTLLARYTVSQAALELLRERSSEDFRKRISGESKNAEMYADDMIPRMEWEISHVTTLYLANNCSPSLIANAYIAVVLKRHK